MNEDKIPILKHPLTTEDGTLNPLCMGELAEAIDAFGTTHQRLKDDPEWSIPQWTFRHQITGAFAMWACRQSPYGVPDGLETVCKYLDASLKTAAEWKVGHPTEGMAEVSLCDVSRMLHEILMDQGIEQFDAWNRCKVGDTPEIQFSSRFDGPGDPDRDFIDLHALLHNVCITIRNERREDARFDAAFEAKHGPLAGAGSLECTSCHCLPCVCGDLHLYRGILKDESPSECGTCHEACRCHEAIFAELAAALDAVLEHEGGRGCFDATELRKARERAERALEAYNQTKP